MKKTFIPPFWEDTLKIFKQAKVPWLELEPFLANYRRQMELINTTQKIATEATKAIIQLQTQYMKHTFEQLSKRARHNFSTSSNDKTTQQADLAKAKIDEAIDHARELNSILLKSNDQIIESFKKSTKDSIDKSTSIAKKMKKDSKNV